MYFSAWLQCRRVGMTTVAGSLHTLSSVTSWSLPEVIPLDIQTRLTFTQSTRTPGGRVNHRQNHLQLESHNLTCELQQIVCQNQSVRLPLFPIRIASSSLEGVTGMMGCSSTKSIGMMLIMMNGSRRKLN